MNKFHLAVLSTFLFVQVAEARVIYGPDNRKEISDANPIQKKVAQAAATMVPNEKISKPRFGRVNLEQSTLRDWLDDSLGSDKAVREKMFSQKVLKAADAGMTFCEGERFVDQPNPGMCSGILIADDLILTAGHCVNTPSACDDHKWVFGFEVNSKTKKAGRDIPVEEVYSCKRVVSSVLSNYLRHDYAIVQLDRPVKNRQPVGYNNEGKISDVQELFVVGSPSGLPLKVADGAKVRKNSHPFYFVANTDTFSGNSGSGVFNSKGILEGLLVRGENDYVPNMAKGCIEANRCLDGDCRGEDITRLTAIPEIGLQAPLFNATETKDAELLREILKSNFWVDIYGADRETALIKGAKVRSIEVIKLLLEKGANVNHQDINGNTALHHLAMNLKASDGEMALYYLKQYGTALSIKNNQGLTPLNLARSMNPEAVAILQGYGVK